MSLTFMSIFRMRASSAAVTARSPAFQRAAPRMASCSRSFVGRRVRSFSLCELLALLPLALLLTRPLCRLLCRKLPRKLPREERECCLPAEESRSVAGLLGREKPTLFSGEGGASDPTVLPRGELALARELVRCVVGVEAAESEAAAASAAASRLLSSSAVLSMVICLKTLIVGKLTARSVASTIETMRERTSFRASSPREARTSHSLSCKILKALARWCISKTDWSEYRMARSEPEATWKALL